MYELRFLIIAGKKIQKLTHIPLRNLLNKNFLKKNLALNHYLLIMRFLKNKVARALQRFQAAQSIHVKVEAPSKSLEKIIPKRLTVLEKEQSVKTDTSSSCQSPLTSRKNMPSNKNIVKNYARAMVNFTLSEPAIFYLQHLVEIEGVELQKFRMFIQSQKEGINSIKTLRELLLVTKNDSDQLAAYKRVFKEICEIFVKIFSVNWIFSSKLGDKIIHLKYRFKILRRIRKPELFTYLEDFNKRC